jgi:26S proteasome regulatory subunit T4
MGLTEAGMFAIRDDREYVNHEDLTKVARKVGEAKKHESEFYLSANITLSDRVSS